MTNGEWRVASGEWRKTEVGFRVLRVIRGLHHRIQTRGSTSGTSDYASCGFPCEHGAFAVVAPAVVADDTGVADDTVAGDEKGEVVAAGGGADGAGGGRLADGPGELAITDDGAVRNLEQGTPHTDLERRA